jgi:hypothetical protein
MDSGIRQNDKKDVIGKRSEESRKNLPTNQIQKEI